MRADATMSAFSAERMSASACAWPRALLDATQSRGTTIRKSRMWASFAVKRTHTSVAMPAITTVSVPRWRSKSSSDVSKKPECFGFTTK